MQCQNCAACLAEVSCPTAVVVIRFVPAANAYFGFINEKNHNSLICTARNVLKSEEALNFLNRSKKRLLKPYLGQQILEHQFPRKF